jgi:hypothetical protein
MMTSESGIVAAPMSTMRYDRVGGSDTIVRGGLKPGRAAPRLTEPVSKHMIQKAYKCPIMQQEAP